MKKITVVIALIVSVAANAQWAEKIKGNGNVTTKNVSTGSYDKIDISGSFDVELIQGTEGKISITGEENLLQYIVTEVKGDALKIHVENNKNIRPSSGKTIVVKVPFQSLNEVTLAGSGDVKSKSTIKSTSFTAKLTGSGNIDLTVDSDSLQGNITGSGDLTLKGKADSFKSEVVGSGDLNAFDLKAAKADANVSGSGNSRIYCTEYLEARISGSGDIDYKGDPKKKDTKVSGSGSISKA